MRRFFAHASAACERYPASCSDGMRRLSAYQQGLVFYFVAPERCKMKTALLQAIPPYSRDLGERLFHAGMRRLFM